MNRGLIIGSVYYGEGNGEWTDYPYAGALVTLRYIKIGENNIKISVPERSRPPENFIIDHHKTDQNGNFSLPFLWGGHDFGGIAKTSTFQVAVISGAGDKPASNSITGYLNPRVDAGYLMKMVADQVLGMPRKMMTKHAVKTFNEKFINKAFRSHFKGALDLHDALTKDSKHYSNEATKFASSEVIKAIGHCSLRL